METRGLQSFVSPSFQSKLSGPRIQSQNCFAKPTFKMFASPLPAAQVAFSACCGSVHSSHSREQQCMCGYNLLMASAPPRDIGGALCVIVGAFFLTPIMLEECKH